MIVRPTPNSNASPPTSVHQPSYSSPPPPPPSATAATSSGVSGWIFSKMNGFHTAHERLKHSVHSYWRQNTYLSPRGLVGKVVMSCFYFSIPVVIGYYVSTKAVAISESTIEQRLLGRPPVGDSESTMSADTANHKSDNRQSKPSPSLRLGGDKILVKDDVSGTERVERVGAGGWGGGVHLVTSDRDTQDINRLNLERFLKKQRRLKERKEEQQRQQQESSSSS